MKIAHNPNEKDNSVIIKIVIIAICVVVVGVVGFFIINGLSSSRKDNNSRDASSNDGGSSISSDATGEEISDNNNNSDASKKENEKSNNNDSSTNSVSSAVEASKISDTSSETKPEIGTKTYVQLTSIANNYDKNPIKDASDYFSHPEDFFVPKDSDDYDTFNSDVYYSDDSSMRIFEITNYLGKINSFTSSMVKSELKYYLKYYSNIKDNPSDSIDQKMDDSDMFASPTKDSEKLKVSNLAKYVPFYFETASPFDMSLALMKGEISNKTKSELPSVMFEDLSYNEYCNKMPGFEFICYIASNYSFENLNSIEFEYSIPFKVSSELGGDYMIPIHDISKNKYMAAIFSKDGELKNILTD